MVKIAPDTHRCLPSIFPCLKLCTAILVLVVISSSSFHAWQNDIITQASDHVRGKEEGVLGFSSCASGCMNMDDGGCMDDILRDTRQVFITMPAKAAGTSMKQFTTKCTKKNVPDNFLNNPDLTKAFLTNSFHLPSIVTSHLYAGDTMIDLVKHASRQTLIIHIHREETDRLLSSIKHVATSRLCAPRHPSIGAQDIVRLHVELNKTNCSIDEGPFVDLIQRRVQEIGFGSPKIFTCNVFEAIEQNAPNMVVHYKQANKLQKLLAKYHCPELSDEEWHPTETNVASEKGVKPHLRLKNGSIIQLDTWLHEKRDLIEYALKMKHDVACQGKVRHMEDDLSACRDNVMKTTPKNVKGW